MSDTLHAAESPAQLRSVVLDSLTVLYHRRSGQTHIVSEPLPEILAALAAEPLTVEGLLDRLSTLADVAPDRAALAARLAELEAIGLVERR
jgi:PqqD family protein of HPr-rel-A system